MTLKAKMVLAFFAVGILGCKSRTHTSRFRDSTEAIISRQVDTPQQFLKNYGASTNDSLFVFVGRNISLDQLPEKSGSIDFCFRAKYVILQKVFGSFNGDTIEFAVFDHYGVPEFSKFPDVLLFVSAQKGVYFHQKYMYNDVYETIEGRWAGAYSIADYEHEYNKNTKLKPVRLRFAKEVSYPTVIEMDGRKVALSYPRPYYRTENGRAIVVYGNYVEELFKLKYDGVLRARKELDAKKVLQ